MEEINPLLKFFAGFALLVISSCNGGKASESQSLYSFIRAVDPKNVLGIQWNQPLPHPCSNQWLGVRCKMRVPSIIEIRLENLNLGGFLDAESVCRLPSLQVLILSNNHIRGSIHGSLANCRNLVHLDIHGNFLMGSLPVALTKLKKLRRLEISNNCFRNVGLYFMRNPQFQRNCLIELHNFGENNKIHKVLHVSDASAPSLNELPISKQRSSEDKIEHATWLAWIFFAVGIAFFLLLTLFLNSRAVQAAKDREILRALALTPIKTPPPKVLENVKVEERCSELVFFVEEHERFGLEGLLGSAADLRNQSFCSSLYIVQLKNNAIFAVKRLKKLWVSYREFGETMRKIGNLKHQNILPLVAYNSTNDEKLLIYRYQKNGSLQTLMQNYIDGKRNFPWKHRLLIAVGIARGLDYIYQRRDSEEIIPHGNIKPSNILLNENEEPLISEYGLAKLLNLNKAGTIMASNGYTAAEKGLTEQGDIYSYGVILLELLTGKIVGTNGLDLPRWVKAKVREEWTGEVFDKEISKVEMYGFSLLNVSLKCVAVSPQERPSISEVLEKIEEIVNAEEESNSFSTISSEPDQQDCCGLASRNTPGSNQ